MMPNQLESQPHVQWSACLHVYAFPLASQQVVNPTCLIGQVKWGQV